MTDGHAWDELTPLLSGPGVEIRGFDADGMTTALIKLDEGFDARPAFAGLPGDHCQIEHWGYVISGALALWMQDGSRRTYAPGELFHWPAGHCPAAVEDTLYVEISPSEPYAALIRHVRGE